MHELPKDLTNSLRSFRGSIYGKRSGQQEVDETNVEKGPEDYGDKEFDRALESNESSTSLGNVQSARSTQQPQYDHDVSNDAGNQGQVPNGRLRHQLPNVKKSRNPVQEPETSQQPQVEPKKPTTPEDQITKSTIYRAPPVKDLDPAAERLALNLTPLSTEEFYELLGMHAPSSKKDGLQDLSKPHGLYSRIYKDMQYTQQKYRAFDIAVYALLIIQLVIGAVFIVLGSLPRVDSHLAIAVLGAVATVISGTLALMQGQGLPTRLRLARDGLKTILFEAEELWWDVRSGRPVLYKDVKKLREDYIRVLQAQKRSHPDMWNDNTDNIAQGPSQVGGDKGGK